MDLTGFSKFYWLTPPRKVEMNFPFFPNFFHFRLYGFVKFDLIPYKLAKHNPKVGENDGHHAAGRHIAERWAPGDGG